MLPALIVVAFTLSPEEVGERDTGKSSKRDRWNENEKGRCHGVCCSHSGAAHLISDITTAPKQVPAMKIPTSMKNGPISISPKKLPDD